MSNFDDTCKFTNYLYSFTKIIHLILTKKDSIYSKSSLILCNFYPSFSLNINFLFVDCVFTKYKRPLIRKITNKIGIAIISTVSDNNMNKQVNIMFLNLLFFKNIPLSLIYYNR